jgi:DNA helicase-2/ATP-dependent DNA helicase PcrA
LSAEDKEISEFIDRISLFTNMDEISSGDYVSLMTIHSAKGLEFPVVFIIGLEEGLLPYCKAMKCEEDISEERRLFYVGMTRAKDILWLTCARKRKLYAKIQDQEPSRFLKDVPKDCCQWIGKLTGHQQIKLVPIKRMIESKHHFTLYTTGCRVKHPTWGIGVVRDCYGDGDDLRLMVNFPNFGVKRLAVKFANLEKV